jgi:hopanoid biosynthesis associated radical SAM protein HpnH
VAVRLRQQARIGVRLLEQRLRRHRRFPLVLQIEPLFACNLSCGGCGKVRHPPEVLRRRMPVETALAAARECGAPVVSIAGGEALLHPEIGRLVRALVRNERFVYLCTNGLLLEGALDDFRPSPYFSWVVHVDGLGDHHDASVGRAGVFDRVVRGVRAAKTAGFSVMTNTTMYAGDSAGCVGEILAFLNDELSVDAMMIAPGYAQQDADSDGHYLSAAASRAICRDVLTDERRRAWRFNHTPLYLDFLAGRVDLECTPWAIPCYSVLGWQRPCYQRADGYCGTYRELIETTDWSRYGHASGDPLCRDCLAHSGFEPSAVLRTLRSPREMARAARETAG